jgi:hypothetical protein
MGYSHPVRKFQVSRSETEYIWEAGMLNKFFLCAIAAATLSGVSNFVQETCAGTPVQTTVIDASAVQPTGFNATLQGGKLFYNWSDIAPGK